MTFSKAAVVNGEVLARRAAELDMGSMISVGPALGNSTAWPRSVYSDAFEAVIGAVYLDGGLHAASQLILSILSSDIQRAASKDVPRDHKSLLLELTQAGSGERPIFEVIREEGPPHRKVFVVSVKVGDKRGQGEGKSKKEAEQHAAEDLLKNASLI